MLDPRALIARLEAADTQELVKLMAKPDAEEEKVLRTYLGNECYQRLRGLAIRRDMKRPANTATTKPNVVVIPGTLGSELSMSSVAGVEERIWLSPRRLMAGQLARLTLDATGLSELDLAYTMRASGIMKRYYGELMLTLAEHCNVHAFWYDWRKDMRIAADQLHARINQWFAADQAVHFVAHGAGGLVTRAYIAQYPQRWARGGRLIMLGTPNHGLFSAVQAFTGQLLTLRGMDLLDTWHDKQDFGTIVQSFPSLYQLLPSPLHLPALEALYEAKQYGPDLKLSQRHLDNARDFHKFLSNAADPERMVSIAGHNQPTFVDIQLDQLHRRHVKYVYTVFPVGLDGDGSVPHRLSLLQGRDGRTIPTYYVEASHGELLAHSGVLNALHELLQAEQVIGQTQREIGERYGLLTDLPKEQRQLGEGRIRGEPRARASLKEGWHAYKQQLDALARRVAIRSGEAVERPYITADECAIEELLTSGFLTGLPRQERTRAPQAPFPPPEIRIRVVRCDIAMLDTLLNPNTPIDAIAVGYYSGAKPDGAMKALDKQVSAALNGDQGASDQEATPEHDLLLTQFAQRGTIAGGLAQLFVLGDPRREADAVNRVVVIAGMGAPSRFGVPELTLLARELCWTLGRMGKRHLATLLIGSGRGNLSTDDAVSAWVRGMKYALTGALETQRRSLSEISLIEWNPINMLAIDKALRNEQEKLRSKAKQVRHGQPRMVIHYTPLSLADELALQKSGEEYVANEWRRSLERSIDPYPIRINVSMEGQTYRFGALTSDASIPERVIPLDPDLVMDANDELADEGNADRQVQLGQFLERLLLPADLRNQFTTDAPLVMMLDSRTARIHWELLAHVEPVSTSDPTLKADDYKYNFWGTSRGLTRQLRTSFAPPPEPLPTEQQILRILVVADPSAEDPLPRAEEEGIAVADLFERFNTVYASRKNRVEVVRLFGPREATRMAVLRHLMLNTYNLLHFAGHCAYTQDDVATTGWIFSRKEILSAHELRRIDRIPQFIFSNACESGVTPDRVAGLAPNFAESFFERGVTNFVCTAWPVDDRAARDFALTLYARLLGLASDTEGTQDGLLDCTRYRAIEPMPMHRAMREARCAIAGPPNDIRTWGAYQHYGNPYFRLFTPSQ